MKISSVKNIQHAQHSSDSGKNDSNYLIINELIQNNTN